MKIIYNLLVMGIERATKGINNCWDYILGNYAAKKQEKIETERHLEALMKDYNSRISDPKKWTISEALNQMREGDFPNSLPGC